MDHLLTRRECLAGLAAAGLAGSSSLCARAVAREAQPVNLPFKVVDSHQHLWDLERFRLPWTEREPAMARNFSMADYLEATAGIPIEKSVYLEVDVDPVQQQEEADYVSELCRRGAGPLAAAVVSGRPASDGFRSYVRQFKEHPYVRGVRQVLHVPTTPPGYCLQPEFIAGIQQLGRVGLSYDICVKASELPNVAKLIDACPDTFFVLDHCGNADLKEKDQSAWRRDIGEVARRDNVVVKISGVIASAPVGWTIELLAPVLNHTLEVFGPDRVMFGGDWPVCTLGASYRQWFDALLAIVSERPEHEQRRLFRDNAVKHYRLG